MQPKILGGILLIGAAFFYVSRNDDRPIPSASISSYMLPMYEADQGNKSRIYREVSKMIEEGNTDSEINDYMREEGPKSSDKAFDVIRTEFSEIMALKSLEDEEGNPLYDYRDVAEKMKEFSTKIGGIDD